MRSDAAPFVPPASLQASIPEQLQLSAATKSKQRSDAVFIVPPAASLPASSLPASIPEQLQLSAATKSKQHSGPRKRSRKKRGSPNNSKYTAKSDLSPTIPRSQKHNNTEDCPIEIRIFTDGSEVTLNNRSYCWQASSENEQSILSSGKIIYKDNSTKGAWRTYTGDKKYLYMNYWYELKVVPGSGVQAQVFDDWAMRQGRADSNPGAPTNSDSDRNRLTPGSNRKKSLSPQPNRVRNESDESSGIRIHIDTLSESYGYSIGDVSSENVWNDYEILSNAEDAIVSLSSTRRVYPPDVEALLSSSSLSSTSTKIENQDQLMTSSPRLPPQLTKIGTNPFLGPPPDNTNTSTNHHLASLNDQSQQIHKNSPKNSIPLNSRPPSVGSLREIFEQVSPESIAREIAQDRQLLNKRQEENELIRLEQIERRKWQLWAAYVSEVERARRVAVWAELEQEEQEERRRRQAWAIEAVESERRDRVNQEFLSSMSNSTWYNDAISAFSDSYEIICPFSSMGCRVQTSRQNLERHLKCCEFRMRDDVRRKKSDAEANEEDEYLVMCPNSILGCEVTCNRLKITEHLQTCQFRGKTREQEERERIEQKIAVVLEAEEERARRVAEDLELENDEEAKSHRISRMNEFRDVLQNQFTSALKSLSKEIHEFASVVTMESLELRPAREKILEGVSSIVDATYGEKVAKALLYGSCASGLDTKESDLDVVISFANEDDVVDVRGKVELLANNLKNGSHAHWITVDHVVLGGVVPVVKATGRVRKIDGGGFEFASSSSESDIISIPIDLSILTPAHTGIQTTSFSRHMCLNNLRTIRPLMLVIKTVLSRRGDVLDDPYHGGVSSYATLLMVVYLLLRKKVMLKDVSATTSKAMTGATTSAISPIANPTITAQSSTASENYAFAAPPPPPVHSIPTTPPQERHFSKGSCSSFGASVTSSPGATASKGSSMYNLVDALVARGVRVGSFVMTPKSDVKGGTSPLRQNSGLSFGDNSKGSKGNGNGNGNDNGNGNGNGNGSNSIDSNSRSNNHHYSSPDTNDCDDPFWFPAKIALSNESITSVNNSHSDDIAQLLLDFFDFYGEQIVVGRDGLSVRGGGFLFTVSGEDETSAPHPQASDPFIIEDPLLATNNVARGSYRIKEVQHLFSLALEKGKRGLSRFGETERMSVKNTSTRRNSIITGASILQEILGEANIHTP